MARQRPSPPTRGGDRLRLGPAHKGGQRHLQGAALVGTTACSTAPVRGCHPQPALLLVGAAAPAVGVAAPWQSGCRWVRAVVACTGATAAATQRGQEGLRRHF
ncbi:hypothetical protein B296_00017800 [Ensete ventricosum]|uniref:Uncharacterized protein n=1 Tax=Ensete ventricosum TaxID=4639 RepID=A0A426YC14_ENSVE|nr:hypothetical protein B296_00017800 [Ensete ventricosum]